MSLHNDTNDVGRWTKQGRTIGATHLIVVCDEFDYTNYPVYVMPDDDVDKIKKLYQYEKEMQCVREVIEL